MRGVCVRGYMCEVCVCGVCEGCVFEVCVCVCVCLKCEVYMCVCEGYVCV